MKNLFQLYSMRLVLVLGVVFLCWCDQALGQVNGTLRGGRVGWARLHTTDRYWQRHSDSDDQLSTFIRNETSLNMDPTWYSASVDNLEDLCTYPLIFANTLASVTSDRARANLVEYLKRGGFLVVDACINNSVNPDPARFFERNKEVFYALLPGCEIRPLPLEHEIYTCFFALAVKPPHTFHNARYDRRWAQHGLYGVFLKGRMVSVITLSGLQCGWSRVPATRPNHAQECMEMMLNIYVYAMTH